MDNMYNKTDTMVYIYTKDGKIETLDVGASVKAHERLAKEGWVHAHTINACLFFERLYNERQDIYEEVVGLGS